MTLMPRQGPRIRAGVALALIAMCGSAQAQSPGMTTVPPKAAGAVPAGDFPRQKFERLGPKDADHMECGPTELTPDSVLHIRLPRGHGLDFYILGPGFNSYAISWRYGPEFEPMALHIKPSEFLAMTDIYFKIGETQGVFESDAPKDKRHMTYQPAFTDSGRYYIVYGENLIAAWDGYCSVDFYNPKSKRAPKHFEFGREY